MGKTFVPNYLNSAKLSWFLFLVLFVVVVRSACPGIHSNPKIPCDDELPEVCRKGPEVYCATGELIKMCYKFEKCQNYNFKKMMALFHRNYSDLGANDMAKH